MIFCGTACLELQLSGVLLWYTRSQVVNGSGPLASWTGQEVCSSSGGTNTQWAGIACSDLGRVTAINLSGVKASGPVDAIGSLTALMFLQLSSNNFSGGPGCYASLWSASLTRHM